MRGGKDGTIRHVMSGVNPQGVHVSGFKVPSAEELDHDYLWRYAWRLPARGDIGIFNRSHYEEVLVVRVHAENLDRQKLPEEEDDYQKAFSEMLSATSTPWAPWYVIPADRKWFARICTAAVLAHTLIEIDPQYPEVTADRRQQLLVVKSELETQAPKGTPSDPFAAKQAKAEAKQAKAEARGEAKEEAKAGASQVGGDARQAQKARSHDQPAQAAPRASRARPKGQPG